MNLEKENKGIKWYRKDNLRIKQINEGKEAIVVVVLDGYNICVKLMLFDFLEQIKEDIALDVKVKKIWDSQHAFVVDANHASDLINYIVTFIDEWNIKINKSTVSPSDIISDELWYSK